MTLISGFQGLLVWLDGKLSAEPKGLIFHAALLVVVVIMVYLGLSWSVRVAWDAGITGGWGRLGLHLLGIGALLGSIALLLSLGLILAGALVLIGALTDLPFVGVQVHAHGLRSFAIALAISAACGSLPIVAGLVRRRLCGSPEQEDETPVG